MTRKKSKCEETYDWQHSAASARRDVCLCLFVCVCVCVCVCLFVCVCVANDII